MNLLNPAKFFRSLGVDLKNVIHSLKLLGTVKNANLKTEIQHLMKRVGDGEFKTARDYWKTYNSIITKYGYKPYTDLEKKFMEGYFI